MLQPPKRPALGLTRTTSRRGRDLPPARLVLDMAAPAAPSWCWREDWRIGGESSYCLLGLFQALNVVSNKRLVAEFFDPVRHRNGREIKLHQVDLRSTETLRVARLTRALRQSADEVAESFVLKAFEQGGARSYSTLRWCPICIRAGYHANIFQMPVSQCCPAHRETLLSRCARCSSPIPYRLDPVAVVPLFSCVHCGLDLIPKLRAGWKKPTLEASVLARLNEHAKLMQFCDRLPLLAAEFLQTSLVPSRANFVVAAPKAGETAARYSAFVTQVMSALASKPQLDWQDPDDACSFSERPLPKCRANVVNSAAPGWPRHLIPSSDSRLIQAACVYRSVRRHVWRRVLRRHHRCVTSACRHLWWSLRDTETLTICPVATAFLRWRMQWESVPIATMLRGRPTVSPLGLVSWLASAAPLGSAEWTPKVDEWLTEQVLGRDLLHDFFATLRDELRRPADGRVPWSPSPAHALGGTCWVCAGRGTISSPARLFVRAEETNPLKELAPSPGHFRRHLVKLAQIVH